MDRLKRLTIPERKQRTGQDKGPKQRQCDRLASKIGNLDIAKQDRRGSIARERDAIARIAKRASDRAKRHVMKFDANLLFLLANAIPQVRMARTAFQALRAIFATRKAILGILAALREAKITDDVLEGAARGIEKKEELIARWLREITAINREITVLHNVRTRLRC